MKYLFLLSFKLSLLFSQEYGVMTTDGQMMTGDLISLDKKGIKLKSKYGNIEVKSEDIMLITYPSLQGKLEDILGLETLKLEKEVKSLEKDLGKITSKNENVESKKTKKSKIAFEPYDDPPIPKGSIRPKYPKEAKELGIEGTVIVQVFVNEKGRASETIILSGIPELNDAAINAIKKVKFRPAKNRGKDVGVWISIPVNFRIK